MLQTLLPHLLFRVYARLDHASRCALRRAARAFRWALDRPRHAVFANELDDQIPLVGRLRAVVQLMPGLQELTLNVWNQPATPELLALLARVPRLALVNVEWPEWLHAGARHVHVAASFGDSDRARALGEALKRNPPARLDVQANAVELYNAVAPGLGADAWVVQELPLHLELDPLPPAITRVRISGEHTEDDPWRLTDLPRHIECLVLSAIESMDWEDFVGRGVGRLRAALLRLQEVHVMGWQPAEFKVLKRVLRDVDGAGVPVVVHYPERLTTKLVQMVRARAADVRLVYYSRRGYAAARLCAGPPLLLPTAALRGDAHGLCTHPPEIDDLAALPLPQLCEWYARSLFDLEGGV